VIKIAFFFISFLQYNFIIFFGFARGRSRINENKMKKNGVSINAIFSGDLFMPINKK